MVGGAPARLTISEMTSADLPARSQTEKGVDDLQVARRINFGQPSFIGTRCYVSVVWLFLETGALLGCHARNYSK